MWKDLGTNFPDVLTTYGFLSLRSRSESSCTASPRVTEGGRKAHASAAYAAMCGLVAQLVRARP